MSQFANGFCSSLLATIAIWFWLKFIWPRIRDQALYNGVRVEGTWEIIEVRDGKQKRVGNIELAQKGCQVQCALIWVVGGVR